PMLLRAAEALQHGAVNLRREELDRQGLDVVLVQKRHLRTGVENEHEPAVAVDRAAHRRTEARDEEVLIGRRPAVGAREHGERGLIAPEVELGPELLEE